MAWGLRTVLWLALLGTGLGQAGIASAQSAKKAAAKPQGEDAAPKKDAAGAQKSLDAGIKAFEAGKHEQAIGSLSSAITSGGLPSQLMAKALYYRGVAFRRSGKPAQAISDLTSALWLKGGLNDTERAQAMENRIGAYREAGLVEPSQVENARNSAAAGRPAAVSEKVPIAPATQPKAAVAAPSPSPAPASAASSWQSSTAVRQAPAPSTTAAVSPATAPASPQQLFVGPQRTARPEVRDPSDAFSQLSTAPAQAALRERVATAPSTAEQPAPAPQQASAGSGGGILKGLFGDLSLGGKAPSRPEAPAPAPVASNVGSADWSQSTRVVGPGGVVKQAAAAPAPVVAAPPPQPEGNYRLQVAAVRTKQEAEAVSAKLRQQHGKELKSRAVEIDEATLANVGTFYRVRVGPYVEANEPRNLCVKLRQKGYDCLVVSVAQ